jgi:hypothetical protein
VAGFSGLVLIFVIRLLDTKKVSDEIIHHSLS